MSSEPTIPSDEKIKLLAQGEFDKLSKALREQLVAELANDVTTRLAGINERIGSTNERILVESNNARNESIKWISIIVASIALVGGVGGIFAIKDTTTSQVRAVIGDEPQKQVDQLKANVKASAEELKAAQSAKAELQKLADAARKARSNWAVGCVPDNQKCVFLDPEGKVYVGNPIGDTRGDASANKLVFKVVVKDMALPVSIACSALNRCAIVDANGVVWTGNVDSAETWVKCQTQTDKNPYPCLPK